MSLCQPTIADLRRCYPAEKMQFDRTNLWGFLVLRRTSFYPTWLLLRMGFSANVTTILSLVIGVGGSVLLATGKSGLDIIGAALINLWNWLDYVDGNIARYKGVETSYGHFLDQAVGSVVVVLFGLGAGIGAYNGNSQILLPFLQQNHLSPLLLVLLALLGVWAYTLRFLLRQSREQFARVFLLVSANDGLNALERGCQKASSVIDHAVSLLPPVLLYHAIFAGMGTFVAVYALLFTLSAAIAFIQMVGLVQKQLAREVHRGKGSSDPAGTLAPPTTENSQDEI